MERISKILRQKAKADDLKSQWQAIYDEVYKYVLPLEEVLINKIHKTKLIKSYIHLLEKIVQ